MQVRPFGAPSVGASGDGAPLVARAASNRVMSRGDSGSGRCAGTQARVRVCKANMRACLSKDVNVAGLGSPCIISCLICM